MADTTALKNRIRAAIKANDNQEITGPVLQQSLLDIVDELDLNPELENEARQRRNGDTQLNNLITGIKNNIDNGYVYAGIATPSTTPASGKVFYLALTAGTYTNFGSTEVSQGINILKYNGASWVKEQALFTDGGVFDISAYRATGGTLATYADLIAALGTNGENIPQSLRKGGMSVKFVQSSDNKYVQYRLMSDSFGTIESDWQNIGLAQQTGLSETVAMSQKAVTDELNKIDSKVDNIKDQDARIRMTEICWSNLKQLRDNGQLIPGMQYRIIDYDCYTTQKDTQSAAHQFDIIVTADSTNKLNEVARAIQHEGDEYFSNCNLAAWKIWYCLDNDKKRFAWADETDGRGVIYRMIDEHGNDCPYDFKNIQFKRYKITAAKSSDLVGTYLGVNDDSDRGISIDSNDSKMFYTFSYLGELEDSTSYSGEVLQDASIVGNTLSSDMESPYGVYNNSIKQFYDSNIASKETIQSLNSIVFLTFIEDAYYGCYSNSFGNGCYSNSFGNDCYFNSFGDGCYSNSFGNDCNSNSFGNNCFSNSFGNYCYSNSFGNDCYFNSFGNNCYFNSFGNDCNYNSFGIDSSNNKLDAYYKCNTFDNGVQYVAFSGIGTSTKYVQNYHIKQGMTFTNNSIHTITARPGLGYELSVAKQTGGTVVEYCEADKADNNIF